MLPTRVAWQRRGLARGGAASWAQEVALPRNTHSKQAGGAGHACRQQVARPSRAPQCTEPALASQRHARRQGRPGRVSPVFAPLTPMRALRRLQAPPPGEAPLAAPRTWCVCAARMSGFELGRVAARICCCVICADIVDPTPLRSRRGGAERQGACVQEGAWAPWGRAGRMLRCTAGGWEGGGRGGGCAQQRPTCCQSCATGVGRALCGSGAGCDGREHMRPSAGQSYCGHAPRRGAAHGSARAERDARTRIRCRCCEQHSRQNQGGERGSRHRAAAEYLGLGAAFPGRITVVANYRGCPAASAGSECAHARGPQ